MSHTEKNAETVKRGYKAFNAADMQTLTEIFNENANWHTSGQSSIGGDFKGRNAAFTQFGRYIGDTAGTYKVELKSVATGDDGRVVGIHRNTGTRNGKQLDVDCCIVFELKDGKIIDGREYFYDLQAWDEFWS